MTSGTPPAPLLEDLLKRDPFPDVRSLPASAFPVEGLGLTLHRETKGYSAQNGVAPPTTLISMEAAYLFAFMQLGYVTHRELWENLHSEEVMPATVNTQISNVRKKAGKAILARWGNNHTYYGGGFYSK